MERGVWGERGRSVGWGGSRIGSNLSAFQTVLNVFVCIFFTLFLCVLFCAFWVPHGCKRGSKEAPGSSFWPTKVDKTCPKPWM